MSETVGKGISERKAWALLAIAGCFEPLWIVSMKLSEGFTQPYWATATFVFLAFSMYFLAQALKGRLAMGTAYAVWVGIGAIGALIAGILLFDEPSDLVRLGFVGLIIIGIVGLQVTAKG